MEYAKKVVDSIFLPILQKQIDVLNEKLKPRGLRAGIDISWFFDKIE